MSNPGSSDKQIAGNYIQKTTSSCLLTNHWFLPDFLVIYSWLMAKKQLSLQRGPCFLFQQLHPGQATPVNIKADHEIQSRVCSNKKYNMGSYSKLPHMIVHLDQPPPMHPKDCRISLVKMQMVRSYHRNKINTRLHQAVPPWQNSKLNNSDW